MHRRALALATSVALAAVLVLALASAAFAAPVDQTMSIAALKTKLDASGPVPGYFKTVLKGDTIVSIPCTVTALVGGPTYSDTAIQFVADSLAPGGGIVAGMSGSPIYVNDGGTDKVVGAVAYGDSYSLGGMGYATPIEAMVAIKQKYDVPEILPLDRPVITDAGVITKVVITSADNPLPGAVADGVAVAHPLGTPLYVGGIPANSRIFKRAQALFAKKGITLLASSKRATSPSLGAESFETTFAPGASVAALQAHGSLWLGGVGTVTYVDSDTVLAYGHPTDSYSGKTSLYMSNAWVDGIDVNQEEPYKLARVGKARGEITQDRYAGIMGVAGSLPDELAVTSTATCVETAETTTAVTYLPKMVVNGEWPEDGYDAWSAGEIPAYASYVAGARLFDQAYTPGSADVTTTITVHDLDADKTLTVTMPNHLDDSTDIPSAIPWDVEQAVFSLRQLLHDDLYHFEITGIGVESKISTHRSAAEVVDVQMPNAPKIGDNPVKISLLVRGMVDTQTIDATFTIPAGMSVHGTLAAIGAGTGNDEFPSLDSSGNPVTVSYRPTIKEIVNALNAQLPGNYISLRYVAGGSIYSGGGTSLSSILSMMFSSMDEESGSTWFSGLDSTDPTVAVRIPTPWAVDSAAIADPTLLALNLDMRPMEFDDFNTLYGEVIDGPSDISTITVYAKPAGSATESFLGKTKVNPKTDSFSLDFEGFRVNTELRVHTEASPDEAYLASDTTITVPVHAYMTFSTSATSAKAGKNVTLSTRVLPVANKGSKVVFEYYAYGRWWKIATKTLSSSSSAKISWKVRKGTTRLRARFLGSIYNAATTSTTRTVKGK